MRLATLTMAAVLLFTCTGCTQTPAKKVSSVTIVVQGTVKGGDQYGIFKVGPSLDDQEFMLTFTFDPNKGKHVYGSCAPDSSVDISGTLADKPTATLEIGNGSYTFGQLPNFTWGVFRSVKLTCSDSEIGINTAEGEYPHRMGLTMRLRPAEGAQDITKSIAWNVPVSAANLDQNPQLGTFIINKPGDFVNVTQGYLFAKSLTVSSR